MSLQMYREEQEPLAQITHIIGVAAGKGGVGKSTISSSLASALSADGFKVGILDCDLYGPSLRRMMPEDRLPAQKGNVFIPALSRGISLLSMAYFRRDNEAAAVRAPIANQVVSHFLTQTAWGKLDYLIIDFPPGTGDIQLTLAQKANLTGVLLVTTPQQVAMMDVRKAAHLFEQVQIPLIGLVENMSYLSADSGRMYPFGRNGGAALAEELGTPLLGQIPLDPNLSACCDDGEDFLTKHADSEAAQHLRAAARGLHEQVLAMEEEEAGALVDFSLEWKEMQ